MKYFFVSKHSYIVKLSPFHLTLLLICTIIIVAQITLGIFNLIKGNKVRAEGNYYYVDVNSNSNTNTNSSLNVNSNIGDPQPTSQEGRLVKLANSSIVYYLSETNHNRYTFPDENVFYSWYYNFNDVETISNNELQTYPLVGNVTIRPGTHLIKIQANPKVYAVEPGGIIRWIVNEQTFYNLGYNFSMVVDVPEIFFGDYQEETPISCACEHPIGALIKYPSNPTVYYWDGSNLRPFVNEGAFWWNRFYWEYLLTISDSLQYPQGQVINNREANLVLSW